MLGTNAASEYWPISPSLAEKLQGDIGVHVLRYLFKKKKLLRWEKKEFNITFKLRTFKR